MATINDLGRSLSDLSDDELFELHRKIRESRRTKKRSYKATSTTKSKKQPIKAAINSMSQDEKDKLIEELLNMD